MNSLLHNLSEEAFKKLATSFEGISGNQQKRGGFPSQFVGDKKPGVWSTSCALCLHRRANFLTEEQVNDLCRYLLSTFRIYKNGEQRAYGWGGLPITSEADYPVPIITCFTLLSLSGLHFGNKRLSVIFELSVGSFLQQQKKIGFWDSSDDYYTNMYAIVFLSEVKNVFDKDKLISKAIEMALTKSRQYVESINRENLSDGALPFYYIMSHYFNIKIEEYKIPSQVELKPDYIRPTLMYEGKSFGFTKFSIIYYLYLASIDDNFYSLHTGFVDEVISEVISKRQANGFCSIGDRGSMKDCIWLSCDILRLLYILNDRRNNISTKPLYTNCVFKFTPPWYISAIEQIRFFIKAGRNARSALRLIENWFGH